MFCVANKGTSESVWFTIPKEHVKKDGEQHYVWVAGPGNRALRRNIEAVSSGEAFVVHSGILATDKIIVQSDGDLTDGCLIEVNYD